MPSYLRCLLCPRCIIGVFLGGSPHLCRLLRTGFSWPLLSLYGSPDVDACWNPCCLRPLHPRPRGTFLPTPNSLVLCGARKACAPPRLVWCGVVWCGVVWCGVVHQQMKWMTAPLHRGQATNCQVPVDCLRPQGFNTRSRTNGVRNWKRVRGGVRGRGSGRCKLARGHRGDGALGGGRNRGALLLTRLVFEQAVLNVVKGKGPKLLTRHKVCWTGLTLQQKHKQCQTALKLKARLTYRVEVVWLVH